MLGPVDIEGTQGTIESKRKRTCIELAAWLVLHPNLDHHAVDEAMWPGRDTARKYRNATVSRLRTWLGTDQDGNPFFPPIATTSDARYALAPAVDSDWHHFQRLTAAAAQSPGPQAAAQLRAALELVRGRPFSGVNSRRYAWAEHQAQDMISAIVDAAADLAEHCLAQGDPRGALWAATKGLDAAPEMENLYRILFRTYAALGDWDALERAAEKLDTLNMELGVDMEEATAEILAQLCKTRLTQDEARSMLSLLLAALVGLVAGAGLRPVVVALAVPAGHPANAICPSCSPQPVPAVGSDVLRLMPPSGRCPNCRDRLCAPWLPELTTAAAFAVVAAAGTTGWYAAAQYWMAFLGAGLLLIDSAVQRLPDQLTLAAAVGTLVLLIAASVHHEAGSLLRAAAVAAAAGGLFTALALCGMGLGDAKLAFSLGAVLGWRSWQAAALALVLTYLLGATVAVILLLTRRRHRKSTLAFGPLMIVSTLGAALITST